jgi:chaperonin cofactor prefoldin
MDERFDRIDERIDRTDTRLDRLEASMVRFDTKLDGFHAALRDQTRTYMLTMTGVMASFAAVVVATGILT